MAATGRASVSFKVKEYAGGQPWVLAEWLSGDDLFGGTLGFELKPGTTLKEAKEIADYLRKHIRGLALTK